MNPFTARSEAEAFVRSADGPLCIRLATLDGSSSFGSFSLFVKKEDKVLIFCAYPMLIWNPERGRVEDCKAV